MTNDEWCLLPGNSDLGELMHSYNLTCFLNIQSSSPQLDLILIWFWS